MVIGQVVHGAKLGRRIGMPTINLLPEKEKMLPPKGVYYSRTKIGEKEYKSITNIGEKPTVSNTNPAAGMILDKIINAGADKLKSFHKGSFCLLSYFVFIAKYISMTFIQFI